MDSSPFDDFFLENVKILSSNIRDFLFSDAINQNISNVVLDSIVVGSLTLAPLKEIIVFTGHSRAL